MCFSALLFKLPLHEVWTNEMEGEAAAFSLLEEAEPKDRPSFRDPQGRLPPRTHHILTAPSFNLELFELPEYAPIWHKNMPAHIERDILVLLHQRGSFSIL